MEHWDWGVGSKGVTWCGGGVIWLGAGLKWRAVG